MALTVLVNLLGSEAIFHPDSFAVTGSALRAIENNGDPGWYMYPAGLLIYLNSLLYGFIFFILKLFGELNSFSEFWSMYNANVLNIGGMKIIFTWPSRFITLFFSVVGVSAVYATVNLITQSKKSAFGAGLLLATATLWVTNSRFATVDIPMSALAISTVYWALRMVERKHITTTSLIILVLLCAMTLNMKYNAALLCAAVFLAFIPEYHGHYKEYAKRFVPMGVGVIIVFFLVNPYLLLHYNIALDHLQIQMRHAEIGHFGLKISNGWWYYLTVTLKDGYGVIAMLFSIVGFVFLLRSTLKTASKLLLTLFPILFFSLMGLSPLISHRYMIPLLPFLAIFSGVGIYHLARKIPLIRKDHIVILLFSICLALNVKVLIRQDFVLAAEDSRSQLRRLLENIESKQRLRVFAGYYIEAILNYQPVPIKEIVSKLPANMSDTNIDLIIFDSFSHDRYLFSVLTKNNLDIHSSKKQEGLIGGHFLPPFKGFEKFLVFRINPFTSPKASVPYSPKSIMSPYPPDLFFRNRPGPFIEIYVRSPALGVALARAGDKAGIPMEILPASKAYFINKLNDLYKK